MCLKMSTMKIIGIMMMMMMMMMMMGMMGNHRVHGEIQNPTCYVPVVFWHGLGDSSNSVFSMEPLIHHVQNKLPGIYVYSVRIGNTSEADRLNGFFMNANLQIEHAAAKLRSISNLTKGFNAIGLSQGGQFLRAYVERYNPPPVGNLITLGGQHQGVYAFPDCNPSAGKECQIVSDALSLGAYTPYCQ